MAMKIKDFNCLKKKRKGIFFTMDSIIATGIIIIVIILASSFYIKEQTYFHLNYLSQDLIRTLSTLTVEEINNDYINSLINDDTITDLDNTVLEQIAEFWAEGTETGLERANKTASNVIEPWRANSMGFGIWINNETIHKTDMPIKKSLVSSKKILSGIEKGQTTGSETRKNPPKLLGPVIVEVRVWQ